MYKKFSFFKFVLVFLIISSSVSIAQKHTTAEINSTQLLITPLPTYLGRIPLGSSALRDVLIFNTSAQTITINSLQIQGIYQSDYMIENQIGSTSLNPLDRLILQIRFTPTVADQEIASLVINSNVGTDKDSLIAWGTRVVGNKVTYERIIGGTEADNAKAVQITPDGGSVIVGNTITSPDEDFPDIFVVRTDRYGAVLWSKNYGGRDSEGANDVLVASDGGFIIVGYTDSFGAGSKDAYLIKTDAQGNVQWTKTYGGKKDDNFYSVIPTGDGGYLAVGATIGADGQNRDAYLVKTNAQGNQLWSKTFGGSSGGEIAYSVVRTSDGGFVFAGSTTSFGAGGFDVYLVKINASGNEQWSKTFGGSDWEEGYSVVETSDKGFAISGYTVSSGVGARDAYLIKTDASGNLQWSKTYGFSRNDAANSVNQTPDGGFILVGSTVNRVTQQNQFTDVYIIKTDAFGVEEWSKLYGGDKSESAADVQVIEDGGYLIAGVTSSYSKNSDFYLIKINETGLITGIPTYLTRQPTSFQLFQNYPNPFNAETIIQYELPERRYIRLRIFDITGRLIEALVDEFQGPGIHTVKFNGNNLSSGLYFYQLSDGTTNIAKKMILIK